MNKITGLLITSTLALSVFFALKNPPLLPTRPQKNERATEGVTTKGASGLTVSDRTKSKRSPIVTRSSTAAEHEDPDASLPPMEETLRAARSTVFNFKHHLCQCQCDLDETRIMNALKKANLEWPRIPDELGSAAMEHNLRVREGEALQKIESDPMAAVAFMRSHIQYEKEKQLTLQAASPWRQSLRQDGVGDGRLFSEMLGKLPDSKFDVMVNENLELVEQSPSLRNTALEQSFKRPPEVRLKTLARLADRGLLRGSAYESQAMNELVSLIGSAPALGDSWLFHVVERLN